MPATPARIGFIREQYRTVVSTTPAAKTHHGNLARASDDPVETWFYSASDAQNVADARQALLSADRRAFVIGATGVDEAMALAYVGAVPIASVTDRERAVTARAMLVANLTIDFERQSSSFTTWG